MFGTVNFTDPVGWVFCGFLTRPKKQKTKNKKSSLGAQTNESFCSVVGSTYKACVESTHYSCCENRSRQWNSSNWEKKKNISNHFLKSIRPFTFSNFEFWKLINIKFMWLKGKFHSHGKPLQIRSRWGVLKSRNVRRRSIKLNCHLWMVVCVCVG